MSSAPGDIISNGASGRGWSETSIRESTRSVETIQVSGESIRSTSTPISSLTSLSAQAAQSSSASLWPCHRWADQPDRWYALLTSSISS